MKQTLTLLLIISCFVCSGQVKYNKDRDTVLYKRPDGRIDTVIIIESFRLIKLLDSMFISKDSTKIFRKQTWNNGTTDTLYINIFPKRDNVNRWLPYKSKN